MKRIVDCPVCDGKAELKAEQKKRPYRNEKFDVVELYYKCNRCNHSFTYNEVDQYNLNLLHNRYREKYNIPSAEQLLFVRLTYGLSQTKMSEVLGFGPNQYRLYESGDMPLGGIATVLSMIIEPEEFKNILVKKKSIFSESEFKKITAKLDNLLERDYLKLLKNILFPKNFVPNNLTGYKLPFLSKFADMVIYFLDAAPFKTKLNKLLFYADFAHFKYFGNSISGCKYVAIDLGPVPDQYGLIFGLLEKKEIIKTTMYKNQKGEFDKFVSLKSMDDVRFTGSEKEILDLILSRFSDCDTNEIIEISHKELAWIENEKSKSIVDYSLYAPQLIAL